MLEGKTIVLGITGGIASYKSIALCSKLTQAGAKVRVMMTKAATQFVTPLTFQTISRHAVAVDTFHEFDPAVVQHIDLADAADLVVVAPATANILAKLAHGIADDMVSTTLLAVTAPIMVAPAMNVHMYDHPAVRNNMRIVQERGVRLIDPGEGSLACGYVGKGRMEEPERIYEQICAFFEQSGQLAGQRVLITAGGTIERIDPVRYIGNDSSGKMGYALAEAARSLGADVTLISANSQLLPPAGVHVVPVVSAQEMFDAVMAHLPNQHIIIKAAAVADYRPKVVSMHKMKKKNEQLFLELEPTTDILKTLGEMKGSSFLVGFAAETEHLEANARKKLEHKQCDLVIVNDVSLAGAGFASETNQVDVYGAEGQLRSYPMMDKRKLAMHLMTFIMERMALPGSTGE